MSFIYGIREHRDMYIHSQKIQFNKEKWIYEEKELNEWAADSFSNFALIFLNENLF